jgi:WD40 repeat protein
LNGHDGAANAVAFSPSGRELASVAGPNGTVRVWNVADPAHPAEIGPEGNSNAGAVNGIAFSPNGRLLAVASQNDVVRLWSIGSDGALSPGGSVQTDGSAWSVAFSPGGHTLAIGTFADLTQLWNVVVALHALSA